MPRKYRKSLAEQMKVRGALGKPLTRRQREYLRLAAHGYTNQQIGSILGLSPHTIKSHLHQLGQQTGIGDRTQLAVWAFAQQLRAQMFDAETLDGLRQGLYLVFESWLEPALNKAIQDLPLPPPEKR